VADDDADVCRTLCSALQLYGYQVDAAHDGAMAWDALNATTYDLIITDHMMPKLTGLELIRKVHTVRPDLPCILISGNMPTEETELIPSHLPFRAVEKPVRLGILIAIARSLMAAHPIKRADARAADQPIACLA
jgi:DNA-binding response OmpR family regulator